LAGLALILLFVECRTQTGFAVENCAKSRAVGCTEAATQAVFHGFLPGMNPRLVHDFQPQALTIENPSAVDDVIMESAG
jgi:hypothetical protein